MSESESPPSDTTTHTHLKPGPIHIKLQYSTLTEVAPVASSRSAVTLAMDSPASAVTVDPLGKLPVMG